MNFVLVTGSTKKNRKLVEGITNWCIKELMPRMRTLDIEIELRETLQSEGVYGWCESADSRIFRIDLHKKFDEYENLEDVIKTVMHEMVHVWQWATGLCKDYADGRRMWKGKDYTDTPYSKQPWERQAYRMQETLYKKWLTETVERV